MDHDLLYRYYRVCNVIEDRPNPNVWYYRDYKGIDMERLSRDVVEQDWNLIFNIPDVTGQVCYFNNLVLSLFDRYVPKRWCRYRNVSNPWFSYTIDRATVQQDIAHRTWSNQKTAANKSRFIMLSKKAINLVRRAKRE
jgi:hypothetical protein